jgi:hypothetical protein
MHDESMNGLSIMNWGHRWKELMQIHSWITCSQLSRRQLRAQPAHRQLSPLVPVLLQGNDGDDDLYQGAG